MGLGLGLQLRQKQRQSLTMEALEPDEREKLLLAEKYWERNPHITMELPVSVLEEIVREKLLQGDAPSEGLRRPDDNFLRENFVMLSPEEMRTLDEEERYGLKLGDYVFVGRGTPPHYVAMVVFNLAMHRHLRSDNFISRIFEDSGIDFDEARHWTASVFDVSLAKIMFKGRPELLEGFMEWRERIERTDCFRNEQVDEILRDRSKKREQARSPRRFGFAGFMDNNFGAGVVDSYYRDFGLSRCDLLLSRIVKDRNFDLDLMIELMEFVRDKSNSYRVSGRKGRTIQIDGRLEQQAYLLTEDFAGAAAILDSRHDNVYGLKTRAFASVSAILRNLYSLRATGNRLIRPISDDVGLEVRKLLGHVDDGSNGAE